MSKEQKPSDIELAEQRRTAIGRGISIVYAACLISYVIAKWEKWDGMEPNAIGDFLAGAFGPLAILWLVLGYFQQGSELKQNTTAIKQQAAELAHAVEEYRYLVEVTRQQHEAEIEHRKAQAALEHARHQPSFDLEATHHATRDGELIFMVEMTNGAVACSQIEIRSWRNSDSDFEKSHTYFKGGDTLKFQLIIDTDPGWRKEYLTVAYRDGNGKMQQLWFRMDVVDMGSSDWHLFFVDTAADIGFKSED